MQIADIPLDEQERLASLQRMHLLDTPDEELFDRVTRVAYALFQVPMAVVSLVDANRQWFKSCIGLPGRETGRDISFCSHAILGDGLFLVPDALADARFADNPLVTEPPHVRFYAGYPVRNAEGYTIGTLCILDHQPRELTTTQIQLMRDLGSWLETALVSRQLRQVQVQLAQELDVVKQRGSVDPLLRIWNRDAIAQVFERELARAQQAKGKLSLLRLAVDQYKPCLSRDAEAARRLLLEAVQGVRRHLPDDSSLGRLESDELLVVLPGMAGATLRSFCDKLGDAFANDGNVAAAEALTLSIGAVSVDTCRYREAFEGADMLTASDQALIMARSAGGGGREVMHFDAA